MSFGPLEILIFLFVVAMIVGPSRINRMVRSLGRGAYDFVDELGRGKDSEEDEKPRQELEGDKNGNERKG